MKNALKNALWTAVLFTAALSANNVANKPTLTNEGARRVVQGAVAQGTIVAPKHPHNFTWGEDGKTLFLAAQSGLYKMRLNIEGVRP